MHFCTAFIKHFVESGSRRENYLINMNAATALYNEATVTKLNLKKGCNNKIFEDFSNKPFVLQER